jgi:hypothetical protein
MPSSVHARNVAPVDVATEKNDLQWNSRVHLRDEQPKSSPSNVVAVDSTAQFGALRSDHPRAIATRKSRARRRDLRCSDRRWRVPPTPRELESQEEVLQSGPMIHLVLGRVVFALVICSRQCSFCRREVSIRIREGQPPSSFAIQSFLIRPVTPATKIALSSHPAITCAQR